MRWNEFYVCQALFQTPMCKTPYCNLIFGETDCFNLSVSVRSLSVLSNTVSRGWVMLKIVYLIYCGMDIRKFFVIACIAPTNKKKVTIYVKHFCTSQEACASVRLDWLKTTAKMCISNAPKSIWFQLITLCRLLATLFEPAPNAQNNKSNLE